MTQLELSLGNQFVWALVQPLNKQFIKSSDEPGFQELNLILSQSNPGPVKVVLEQLPGWAQKQIKTAIKSGQLINSGDKIDAVSEQNKQTEVAEKTTKSKPKSSSKN